MRRLGFFLILLTILIIPLSAKIVNAQTSVPFYWDRIDVDIYVQDNGDMLIEETQRYTFTEHDDGVRYRWIPLDKVDEINSIEVFEYSFAVFEYKPLSYTTGVEDNKLWIRWSHQRPGNFPAKHTFVLKYRVRGGLHISDTNDQVYWKAISGERDAYIWRASATVHLPEHYLVR